MNESRNNFSPRKFALLAPALLALLITAGGGVAVRAQDAAGEPESRPGAARGGGNLLRALNLSPEQRAQIRAIRRETVPQGRALGARLRQARRALDEAIYADAPDDKVIEERLREVSAAQAAVVRARAFTELKIRRVLSPAQLNAFRQLQSQPRIRQQRGNQAAPPGEFDGGAAPDPRVNGRQRRRQREPRP